jgi:cytochrome d ubiquinol oxidase subunit II
MAAVYLAADAVRLGRPELAQAFRVRALATAVVAGAIALAGLFVVRDDARPIWDGLTSGWGLVAVLVSVAAGGSTIALVWRGRFEPARLTASVAVAAIIAGWALAQRPRFLPGLTIEEAAAGRSTLIALLVSCAVGAVLLIPSLALLFGYKLRGRFDEEAAPVAAGARPGEMPREPRWAIPASATSLAVGAGLLFLLESTWAHVIGYLFLLGFIGFGFVALAGSAVRSEVSEERL